MFGFLKNLFSRTGTQSAEKKYTTGPELRTRTSGSGLITRTCKVCGKTFTLPESVQHWPDYCQECRAKYRPVESITRTCKGCGCKFTFLSSDKHWPRYCRECRAKRKRRTFI